MLFYVHIVGNRELSNVQSATCPVRELAYPRVVQ